MVCIAAGFCITCFGIGGFGPAEHVPVSFFKIIVSHFCYLSILPTPFVEALMVS